MLQELRITNLAIIDDLHVRWESGLTALTGETGAGKSILIGALKLLSGEKAGKNLIRKGADRLKVEAVFDLPQSAAARDLLAALEIDCEDSEIILEREVFTAGKNRTRINGSVVPLQALVSVCRLLLDLHGQHEQQSLIHPGTHLGYADRFGGLGSLAQNYSDIFREWTGLQDELRRLESDAESVREKRDFYSWQYEELKSASILPGEEDALEEKLRVLSGLEKITGQLGEALDLLENDVSGIIPRVGRLRSLLEKLESRGSSFSGITGGFENAAEVLDEILRKLQACNLPDHADPEDIDRINSRIALIQRLKTKYRLDTEGLIKLQTEREGQLSLLRDFSAEREALVGKVGRAHKKLCCAGKTLSSAREKSSAVFQNKVNARLSHLGMSGSVFRCEWKREVPAPMDEPGRFASGFDRMQFLFSANAGEPPSPLHQVISGGESSRVMLALKAVLSEADPVPLLVFDEIDVGIGGVTANRVGEALRELSAHHQVIVITHLHQVAARAAHQLSVTKTSSGGRTVTRVCILEEKERIRELARMMGDETSQATLNHAEKLLVENQE